MTTSSSSLSPCNGPKLGPSFRASAGFYGRGVILRPNHWNIRLPDFLSDKRGHFVEFVHVKGRGMSENPVRTAEKVYARNSEQSIRLSYRQILIQCLRKRD